MEHQEIDDHGDPPEPVLLAPDNFTPPHRTPWGGRRIGALKGWTAADPIGESWELSVEPSFPSRTKDGRVLDELLRRAPGPWLGAEADRGSTALLVKLLDAQDELSVQIHPRDDYEGLSEAESGKPESWYIVDREPGAGLYLGLSQGAGPEEMERALAQGDDVSELLPFVPVEPGDFFLIEAGTPHCIGGGVLLVEPQRVLPGRRGVTYRYWDWNRRYDAHGARHDEGTPRALHQRDAIAVTDWSLPRGDALLRRVRRRAGPPDPTGIARVESLAGPDGLSSDALRVARLHGTGEVDFPRWDALVALTVLAGRVRIGPLEVGAGRTAAVPASWRGRASLRNAHAVLAAAVVP